MKQLTILILCIYASILYFIFPSVDRGLCMAAMLVSAIGDMFLANVIKWKKCSLSNFVLGASAFGVAHIIYAGAYLLKFKNNAARVCMNTGTIAAISLCMAFLLLFLGICRYRRDYRYQKLIMAYVCLIALNCAAVFTYAWETGQRADGALWAVGAAVGAISFLVSDVCLGLNRVAGMKGMYKLVWILYPIGQFLLITCG